MVSGCALVFVGGLFVCLCIAIVECVQMSVCFVGECEWLGVKGLHGA